MSKFGKYILSLLLMLLMIHPLDAQCKIQNSAFKSGEEIIYDLYFNFGLIKARAGRGALSVTEANYRGERSFKTVMLFNSSGVVNSIYGVNDTLTSYVDMDLRPLLFTKEAYEGGDHYAEMQSFNYDDNKVNIRTVRFRNGEEKFDDIFTTDRCTYDYLSVLSLVRNLDFTGLSQGDSHHIQFISGKRAVNMYVNYQGISSIKANDGNRYEVIDISMTIHDDAFTDQKDALRASLTNDKNRIPVIIDTGLKVGTVRAVLRDVTGLRN